jgi:DNA-binding MarR family transcriptional regulator
MNEIPLDAEAKALEAPGDHKSDIRLWLRLLTCTTLIEGEIRRRLREQFDVTLPRFDLMAQLDKASDGMTLGEVSKRMMVSNGNVTHVVEKLVASGHVDRRPASHDRRVQIISLTTAGQAEFRAMAKVHEDWLADMFAGLSENEETVLMELLAKTKTSVKRALDAGPRNGEARS